MSNNTVITGANRGIGLSLCALNQARGYQVYAICRQTSPALSALGVTVIDGIDVSSAKDIQALKQSLAGVPINVLINNAGILRDEILGSIDYSLIEQQFMVNALGPLRVSEALLPNLSKGSKVAMITSRMGSIADNTSGGRYGYRMSKVALNMAAMSFAHDVRNVGIAVALLHPGLVGTDMIGGYGNVTPNEAAERLMTRIDELTIDASGKFWHADGPILPW